MAMNPTDLQVSYYGVSNDRVSSNFGSGITVLHIPSQLGITCGSERSQYANKEKALQLLEALLLAIESEKHIAGEQAEFQRIASIPNKVQMIKDVRQAAGCGLKAAKEAVDLKGNVADALLYVLGNPAPVYVKSGSCELGIHCCCGGDVPAIREGCYNWSKA
jgi:hypothetical protein